MTANKILQHSGRWILLILSAVPLVLWLFEPGLSFKFYDLPIGLRSLGDVFGLCGMAMFSLVLILSARFKFLERFFKGMNESYTVHHFFGALAFCMLLFHPLLIAYDYLSISFRAVALFLLPGANIAQNFGIFGLFIMTVALVITFYTKLKYQVWKFTHKFLGVAFIFAFLHTFLIGYDVASNYPLKVYLFVLGSLALVAYFCRSLFPNYLVKTFDYKVKDTKSHPDKIWEIEFEDRDGKMPEKIKFKAGQFVFLKLFKSYLSEEAHPFTISSAPGQPLRLAIKELGDYTNKLSEVRAGDLATVEGPFGVFDFRAKQGNKNQVWVAGGIGITPFLSMLRSFSDKDQDYKIDLYYSVKNENCLAFSEEMKEKAEKNKNLNIIFWITEKRGFLTADSIKANTSEPGERDYFICGPPVMMSALKKQLLQQGIKKNKVHTEEFQLY